MACDLSRHCGRDFCGSSHCHARRPNRFRRPNRRAALDAALDCGLAIGGGCPSGRRAEDGVIAECYPLVETPSKDYRQRTKWNVRDSDAALIVVLGELSGGSRLTARTARSLWIPAYAGMTSRAGSISTRPRGGPGNSSTRIACAVERRGAA
jgi:hypothetical protein